MHFDLLFKCGNVADLLGPAIVKMYLTSKFNLFVLFDV